VERFFEEPVGCVADGFKNCSTVAEHLLRLPALGDIAGDPKKDRLAVPCTPAHLAFHFDRNAAFGKKREGTGVHSAGHQVFDNIGNPVLWFRPPQFLDRLPDEILTGVPQFPFDRFVYPNNFPTGIEDQHQVVDGIKKGVEVLLFPPYPFLGPPFFKRSSDLLADCTEQGLFVPGKSMALCGTHGDGADHGSPGGDRHRCNRDQASRKETREIPAGKLIDKLRLVFTDCRKRWGVERQFPDIDPGRMRGVFAVLQPCRAIRIIDEVQSSALEPERFKDGLYGLPDKGICIFCCFRKGDYPVDDCEPACLCRNLLFCMFPLGNIDNRNRGKVHIVDPGTAHQDVAVGPVGVFEIDLAGSTVGGFINRFLNERDKGLWENIGNPGFSFFNICNPEHLMAPGVHLADSPGSQVNQADPVLRVPEQFKVLCLADPEI